MDGTQDDPLLRLKYYQETGQTDKAQQYEQYLKETGQLPSAATHRPLNKEQLARLATSQAEKNAAELSGGERLMAKLPETATKKFLGAAALPLQGLPGGEAAEAFIGAKASGTPYRDALRTQRETTGQLGTGATMALKGVGGVAGMAIPGAGSLLSRKLGQAALGAAYGATEADPDETGLARGARAVGGAVAAPLVGLVAEKLAGTNLAAKAMGVISTMLKDSPTAMRVLGALTPQAAGQTGRMMATPIATPETVQALEGMAQWGTLSNPQRAAVRRLGAASARDTRAGLSGASPFPKEQGMPQTLGVDVASPYVMEEARGAARSTPGREAFAAPFAQREQGAIPSITAGVDDAMAQRYAMAQARKDAAQTAMEKALAATTGKPIDLTPELKEVLATPAGKAATKSAIRSRRNVPERPLPEIPASNAPTVPGFQPTAFVPPGQEPTETGMDAEALHLVTRALRRMAQGEAGQQKPAGKAASDAIAAGDLRKTAMEALPPEFKDFLDQYRTASEEIAALDLGRTKHPLNPTGLGKAEKSLTDVERMVSAMNPQNRAAFEVGKQHDLASRLRAGQSVESMADELKIPGGQTQREANLSGSAIQPRVRAWDQALQTQRNIVGGNGPARVRTGEGVTMDVVAPTQSWAAVRALREMFGKLSDRARESQGAQDAAFAKLLTQAAPEYAQSLANAKTPAARQKVVQAILALVEAQHKY